jgi:WD40 repeat protein
MPAPRILLSFLLLALAVPALCARPEPPLPNGARVRLGSIGIPLSGKQKWEVSPDGKYVVVEMGDYGILFDRARGTPLSKVSLAFPVMQRVAFAPTGQCAALLGDRKLELRKLPSGKLLHRIEIETSSPFWPWKPSFSGDGKLVALGTQARTRGNKRQSAFVWEVATGKLRGTFEVIQNWNCGTALSPDGKVLATWGEHMPAGPDQPGQERRTIQLWDVASGTELRRLVVHGPDVSVSVVAFASNGKHLVVASDFALDVFDAQSGKHAQRLESGFAASPDYRDGVQFSPDGGILMCGVGADARAYDFTTRKPVKLGPMPKGASPAYAFPGQGQILAVTDVRQAIVSWDAIRGKPGMSALGHCAAVIGLGFTEDGAAVRSASVDGTVLGWEPVTGKPPREWTVVASDLEVYPVKRHGLILSADGGYMATNRGHGHKIQVTHLTSGRTTDFAWQGEEDRDGLFLAFSPDGTRLAAADRDLRMTIWDMQAAKQSGIISTIIPDEAQAGSLLYLAWSPDGKRIGLACEYAGPDERDASTRVMLFDPASGKQIYATECPLSHQGLSCGFALGSRFLAIASARNTVILAGSESGKELRRLALGGSPRLITALAFSPDRRMLAVGLGGDWRKPDLKENFPPTTVSIQIWELATARMRAEYTGHAARINCLAFSPDSRTLASGSDDTTVILWDTTGAHGQKPRELAGAELAAAWAALAGPDAEAAFRAQTALMLSPTVTTAFLRERLKPAPPDEFAGPRLERLIANLDRDDFETRNRATRTLEKLGDFAEAALRKARTGNVSLEMRRRIDDLLARLEGYVVTSDELQAMRAIEVLERIATPDARRLLESLANGSPTWLQTREARAALARMKRP